MIIDPNSFLQDEKQASKMAAKHLNRALVERLQKSYVKDIALRASELDEAGRQMILNVIAAILQKKAPP